MELLLPIAVIGIVLLLILLVILIVGPRFIKGRTASQSKDETSSDKSEKATRGSLSAQRETKAQAKAEREKQQAQAAKASTPETVQTPPRTSEPVRIQPPDASKPPPGEKIRILIVDDNEGTRENVMRLLYFEDDLEVIGQAVNGRLGLDMAIELKPHIALMDINMPDMDGITATQKMNVEAPFSQVVIMSVQNDPHYMKRAMAAGARDYQPKPFTSEELVSCIRRVYNIGLPMYRKFDAAAQAELEEAAQPSKKATLQEKQRGPLIVVYSPKGGVGTSAIASNLAVALQQAHGEIILMDGALQCGDVMVHLNVQASHTLPDLIHDGLLEADLLPDILLSHKSGLKLLLGPANPQLADVINPEILTEIVNNLKDQGKGAVIDTDSQLTDETVTLLDLADYILIVTMPELPAIKDVKLFLELAEQLSFDQNRLKLIINFADKVGGVSPKKVQDVLKLDHAYLIPQDPRMDAALRRGEPVVQHDAMAPSALAITDIAEQVWRHLTEEDEDLEATA